MISRRSFLVGLGGIVTSAFIARVRAHVEATHLPLLLDPGRAEETLHVYPTYHDDPNQWTPSLGPQQWEAPPVPTWREYLRSLGHRLGTREEIEAALAERSLSPEELDSELDAFGWEDMWEHNNSPTAKAYWLLKDLGIDCGLNAKGGRAGRMEFHSCPNPMSSWHWVELRDDVSISLLQARLVEAGHPIRVVMGEV